MSIDQLSEPCWVIHLKDTDEVHCETEASANTWATPEIQHHVDRIVLAEQPCWIATCDTCGDAEPDENGNTMHFPDNTGSEVYDLVRNPDGTYTCDECHDRALTA